MKIAVLSGKGGTGKTFVAVNLASVIKNATYVDCDVEEPNGRLFFEPELVKSTEVNVLLPDFDAIKCTGCKKCVEFCAFNALFFIKEKPKLFSELCHSCGGCKLVCSNGAITEIKKRVGVIEEGFHNDIKVISGILDLGEISGVPVIKQAIMQAMESENVIIDCPPGSSCSVMESIQEADYCILVTEPTSFGFHNFKMVYELTKVMGKKVGVIFNKVEDLYEPLEKFCMENSIPVLLRIPFLKDTAKELSKGTILCEKQAEIKNLFLELLKQLGGAISN